MLTCKCALVLLLVHLACTQTQDTTIDDATAISLDEDQPTSPASRQAPALRFDFTRRDPESCTSFVSSVPDIEGLGHAQANRNLGMMLAASLADTGICYSYSPLNELVHLKKASGHRMSVAKAAKLGQWERLIGVPEGSLRVASVLKHYVVERYHVRGASSLQRYSDFLRAKQQANHSYVFYSSDTFNHCPSATFWAAHYQHRMQQLDLTAHPVFHRPDGQTVIVAIHLRRFDISTFASHAKRIHKDSFFTRVLSLLREYLPRAYKMKVHVFTSTFFTSKRESLRNSILTSFQDFNVTVHVNTQDTETFNAFISADILVVDMSRFSHLAGLWSSNIKVSSPFRYATDCDDLWITSSHRGDFTEAKFRAAWHCWRNLEQCSRS
jgi:hypothetical protein